MQHYNHELQARAVLITDTVRKSAAFLWFDARICAHKIKKTENGTLLRAGLASLSKHGTQSAVTPIFELSGPTPRLFFVLQLLRACLLSSFWLQMTDANGTSSLYSGESRVAYSTDASYALWLVLWRQRLKKKRRVNLKK